MDFFDIAACESRSVEDLRQLEEDLALYQAKYLRDSNDACSQDYADWPASLPPVPASLPPVPASLPPVPDARVEEHKAETTAAKRKRDTYGSAIPDRLDNPQIAAARLQERLQSDEDRVAAGKAPEHLRNYVGVDPPTLNVLLQRLAPHMKAQRNEKEHPPAVRLASFLHHAARGGSLTDVQSAIGVSTSSAYMHIKEITKTPARPPPCGDAWRHGD